MFKFLKNLSTRLRYNSDWADTEVSHQVMSIDGSPISGLVMVKREGGNVLYRRPSDEEAAEIAWMQAIR